MIYEEIEEKIKNSPSLKLFRSKKASLMICFFYKQFKTGSDIVVNGEKIVEELAGFIEKYSFNDDDDEMLQSSSDSVSKAKRLLNN